MPQSKYFRLGIWILLIFAIVLLGSHISFVFRPIGILITTLSAPIIIAGVLYYILRPIVNLLCKIKIPKVAAILSIYLVFVSLIAVLVITIGPILQQQFMSLVNSAPQLINELSQQLDALQNSKILERFQDGTAFSITNIVNHISKTLTKFTASIGTNIIDIITSITSFIIVMVTVPFILFYMLKDGSKLPRAVLKLIPSEHRKEGAIILKDMDQALSGYIQGQILISCFDGICIYIWYRIIGLDYPLILALVAVFTNVIPFIGPVIGTVPGVIVGFIQKPMMAVYVVIGVVIIQQIESNLVSPQVMGRKLDVHPLTIILILLAAGNIGGFVGLLLAIPTYAVLKVVVTRSYQLYRLHKKATAQKTDV
ncbi:AI-2E family transporter [Scopulibacillus cellulosilyticus]|uniref:AI-2E family transporter n=1 Tax=Scopulibacillus cellulosilyticus TaxID=2665665 RepID=A0ABW2PT63_9BACL